jgi:PKD domain
MRSLRWLVGAGVVTVLWLPASAAAVVPHMTYHGGPVMHRAGVYVVDYDATVPSALSDSDPGFFQTMAAHAGAVDSVFAVAAEYPDSTAAAANGIAYLGQSTITPAAANDTATITDTQMQNELRAQITAGHLPAPAGDGMTTVYAVVLPPNKDVSVAGNTDTACGFHFDTTYGAQHLLGAVVVDTGSPQFAGGCGTSNAVANHESFLSHEVVETITDPLVNSANYAWIDDTNGELGDPCITGTGSNYGYTVQKLWSNALASCVATEANHFSTPSVALDPLPSPTAGQPAPFGASGSSTNKATATGQLGPGIAAYSWSFGDGGSATGQTTSHTFAAAGVTSAAVTAIDALGFTASTSGGLTVAPAPPPPPSDPGTSGGGGSAPGSPVSPAPPSATAAPLAIITVAGKAKLTRSGQRLVLDTGRTAACPAGAGTCLVHIVVRPQLAGSRAARAAAARTIGTATLAIQPGHSARLKLTLSKTAAKLVRNRHLRITVTLTGERGTVTGTPSAIKLNLPTPTARHTAR